MKSTIFSLLALPAFFASSLAAPAAAAAEPENAIAIEKRQVADLYSIANTLYTDASTHTANIMSVTDGITDTMSAADKQAAIKSVRKDIKAITSLVNDATTAVQKTPTAAKLARRQAEGDLAQVIAELIADVSNALDSVEATLGLGSLLGLLSPLSGSLSRLLLALNDVVGNLLLLVRRIVNQLLTGLAGGLVGLPL